MLLPGHYFILLLKFVPSYISLYTEPKLDFTYLPLCPWLGGFAYSSDTGLCCLATDRAHFWPSAGESVLTGNGPKWQRTRRLLTPSFHFAILKPYVKVFSDCTDVLLVSSAAQCSVLHPMLYSVYCGLECMQWATGDVYTPQIKV